jgi:hypothetical protein
MDTARSHEQVTASILQTQEMQEFLRALNQAFREVAQDLDCLDVLSHFRYAYEYRKQFPDLNESGRVIEGKHENGLAHAIRSALMRYSVPKAPAGNPSGPQRGKNGSANGHPRYLGDGARMVLPEISNGNGSGIDDDWRRQFVEASEIALCDRISVMQLTNALERAHIDVAHITVDDLRGHVAHALNNYYQLREVGTSYKPW